MIHLPELKLRSLRKWYYSMKIKRILVWQYTVPCQGKMQRNKQHYFLTLIFKTTRYIYCWVTSHVNNFSEKGWGRGMFVFSVVCVWGRCRGIFSVNLLSAYNTLIFLQRTPSPLPQIDPCLCLSKIIFRSNIYMDTFLKMFLTSYTCDIFILFTSI